MLLCKHGLIDTIDNRTLLSMIDTILNRDVNIACFVNGDKKKIAI